MVTKSRGISDISSGLLFATQEGLFKAWEPNQSNWEELKGGYGRFMYSEADLTGSADAFCSLGEATSSFKGKGSYLNSVLFRIKTLFFSECEQQGMYNFQNKSRVLFSFPYSRLHISHFVWCYRHPVFFQWQPVVYFPDFIAFTF